MERKLYIVTDKAGPRVAGQRVKPKDKLSLTDLQAAAELRFGNIEPMPESKPKADNAKA